ncbi:MAG TPA: hypothetical protein VGG56_14040 [Terracidiphilus sp.]|jgi:hypothetical protein
MKKRQQSEEQIISISEVIYGGVAVGNTGRIAAAHLEQPITSLIIRAWRRWLAKSG